jgi:hypothetical protein
MNHTLLVFHSLLRWAITILLVIVLVKSLLGWLSKSKYGKADNLLSLFLMICADIQLLIGLVMYFFTSDMVIGIREHGEIMKNSFARFWAVEHITGMIAGIALIHIGRILSKKATTDEAKFKKQFIFFLLATLIIMATIPWPGSSHGRELMPQF